LSIFSIFKSRDKPRDNTAGGSFRFLFGGSTAGKLVNERSSMQVSAVYACVRVLAESLAGLPLQLFMTTGEGSKEKAVDHPLYEILYREPNPEMTSFNFREALMTHLLLWGNAYAQIIRNGKGEVVALYPLMPNRMSMDRDENGQLYYEYQTSTDDARTMKGSTVVLMPSEVMHIPGMGFDGILGYSAVAMSKNAIGASIATEEYGSRFFSNNATPSGVLEHPGIVKDPEKVRESWNTAFGGSGNSHKVAVLEEGMKFTPMSIPNNEAQFLETRKFQIDEICRIFNVPPHMIADLEHATFSNIEQESLNFVIYSLRPWIIRWEQAMEFSLLSAEEKKTYFIRFNVDALLRADYQSRMNGYATGIQNGILSVNDVRTLENMDLLSEEDGGNLHVMNGNVIKLADAGGAYKSGSTAQSEDGSEKETEETKPEESGNDLQRKRGRV
jgi:HK97 family phage portal protein